MLLLKTIFHNGAIKNDLSRCFLKCSILTELLKEFIEKKEIFAIIEFILIRVSHRTVTLAVELVAAVRNKVMVHRRMTPTIFLTNLRSKTWNKFKYDETQSSFIKTEWKSAPYEQPTPPHSSILLYSIAQTPFFPTPTPHTAILIRPQHSPPPLPLFTYYPVPPAKIYV